MPNCKGCCFVKAEDNKQVGCIADKFKYLRLNTAEESTDDGFFNIDRNCLYKRKEDWSSDLTDKQKIEKARSQLTPNIGICIDDDSEDPKDLENIIEKICNSNYPKNRLMISIFSDFGKSAARIPKIVSKVKSKLITSCFAVFKIEDNVYENETNLFRKMSNSTFLCRISSKSDLEFDEVFNQIDKLFNQELSKVLIFESKGNYFISKSLVSSAYLDFKDYNKMQESLVENIKGTEYFIDIT